MRVATLMLLGGVVFVGACQDMEPTGPLPAPQTAMARVDLADQDQAAAARAVPGFGGFFIDELGRPTVYVTDLAEADRARASVAELAREQGFSPNQVMAKVGQFPYDQLQQAFERASHAALPLAGTVFADLDEARNRVVVGVENSGLIRAMELALERAGLEAGSFEVIEQEPIYQVATLRDEFNPTVGGIQIHFTQYVCTLGANVMDGTQRSFITNSHCTATQGGVQGTVYYQPSSSVNGTVIATEVEDPNYFKNGACPRGRKCRYSDSARALYSAAQTSTLGSIAITSGPNNGSLTVTGNVSVGGTGSVSVGTQVNKVGRTSGWTRGNVSRTCVNTGVSGSQIVQLCQHWVTGSALLVAGGDSGSGVWTGSGTVSIVGLLWGGSGDGRTFIFSPINQVQQELGTLTFK